MDVLQLKTKLMAAVLVTFLLVAPEAPAQLPSHGPRETLAVAPESRSRKFNAGRKESDSDKGDMLVLDMLIRSKRRLPPAPPAPMRNRHQITASIKYPPH